MAKTSSARDAKREESIEAVGLFKMTRALIYPPTAADSKSAKRENMGSFEVGSSEVNAIQAIIKDITRSMTKEKREPKRRGKKRPASFLCFSFNIKNTPE